MPLPIEAYALIGDCNTAALVGRDGSIDWLCRPRFDSAACFAALLGSAENGRWLIAPSAPVLSVSRCYRPGTLVLETEFETETGRAAIIDFMPPGDGAHLVRIVIGRSGRVDFQTELVVRFNYGATVPWVNRLNDGTLNAIAGPERLVLRTPVALRGEDLKTVGEFAVEEGQLAPFVLTYGASFQSLPPPIDASEALARTEAYWRQWSDRCPEVGRWSAVVKRSLITLKALTYGPTGGIVAAATTSLPERLGGVRNWDYRYCWLRDASFALDASLLLIPLVGFLPANDRRVQGTLRAIEDRLLIDGEFVLRYDTEQPGDGLPPGEGAFLVCSFWLVDNYILQGRQAEAGKLFERLLSRCNDVGLLAEELDPQSGRMLGNFPQAYSHVGLINCALNLTRQAGPAEERAEQ